MGYLGMFLRLMVLFGGVVIRPDEVYDAIGKLTVNKASSPDQITAKHLKYASLLCALCLFPVCPPYFLVSLSDYLP